MAETTGGYRYGAAAYHAYLADGGAHTIRGTGSARAARECIGGRPSALHPERRAEVQRMRREGRAAAEIAALFRVSPATVRRIPAAAEG